MASSAPDPRRATFNTLARAYDAVRPGYPAALIEDVIAESQIGPDDHILEIGCGTGQATLPFARRGYAMTCVDLGPEMIAIAARKCRQYPKVQFHTGEFERWQPQRHYDLVISATAFHWIPPAIAYPKVFNLLQPRGVLSIFRNEHPTPLAGFAADVQSVYQQVLPEWRHPDAGPSTDKQIQQTQAEILGTGLFAPVIVRTYRWSQTYSAEEYVMLLDTYSDHHNLAAAKRERLFSGIRELICQRYGGGIHKEYLAVLYLAHKRKT